MGYRELLRLYKKNKLHAALKEQVEADIEKQEAISEYLLEREEEVGIGLPEEMDLQESARLESQTAELLQPDFARMVNRSIRRAFLKMGIAAAAIAISGVLVVLFLLPKAVAWFYYDPGAKTGKLGNRMSLDLAVYTELRIPGYQRDTVTVQDRGYGNYDIMIPQWYSYHDKMTHLTGRISKGNLILYNPNILNPPAGNAFAWFQIKGDSSDSLTELIDQNRQVTSCAAGNRKTAQESLDRLHDTTDYLAYVTLDRMMPYETFVRFVNQLDSGQRPGHIWCAVCTENGIASESAAGARQGFSAQNMGFSYDLLTSHALDWDRETYPQLVLWEQDATGKEQAKQQESMQNEAFAKTHFTSMLRYLADQEVFLEMMGDRQAYRQAADYVEQNGLMVYGFAGIGTKEMLKSLLEEEAVYEIYTQELY